MRGQLHTSACHERQKLLRLATLSLKGPQKYLTCLKMRKIHLPPIKHCTIT